MAVEDYNWKLPTTLTQQPVTFEDLVTVISRKEWYNKNVALARKQLWMMQYGIFRSDYDDWIRNFENKWLEKHNVKYFQSNKITMDGTKGCVYSIVSKHSGNFICDRFKRICHQVHGEFMSNRKRKNKEGENCTYIKTKLHRFMGYVVQSDCKNDPYMDCMEVEQQHIRKVRVVVCRALSHGVEGNTLEKLLQICIKNSKGKCVLYDMSEIFF